MLPLAMIILPTPPINTLTTHLDKPDPALPPSTTSKNTISQRVRRDGELVPLELSGDFFRVVPCFFLKLDRGQ